jgi:hypothetical protein
LVIGGIEIVTVESCATTGNIKRHYRWCLFATTGEGMVLALSDRGGHYYQVVVPV